MLKNLNKVFCRFSSTNDQTSFLIKDKILKKLNEKFTTNLIHAQVNNLGWKNNEPKESEKFLEVIVVTTEFESVPKAKREEMIKSLIENESKGSEITLKLLTPSKWFDSNQRGLKLKEAYCNPPVLNGNLLEIAQKFYQKPNSQ